MDITARPIAAKSLLSPRDHVLIMIDHQSQMAFAAKSCDIIELRNNAGLVASTARDFETPVILTTVAASSFSGPIFSEIIENLPNVEITDRTTMNTWEDENVIARVNNLAPSRLVICGLWTSVCIVGPVLSALEQGYDVYVITDASGDTSVEAHERAVARMMQAGARPMTALQYLLELQRDWARADTYAITTRIAAKFGGAYGIGIDYANSMFGAHEGG